MSHLTFVKMWVLFISRTFVQKKKKEKKRKEGRKKRID
jgi:hypothetical protein